MRLKSFLISLLVLGAGIDRMPEILSGLNFLYPFPIKWSRYMTSDSTNYNLPQNIFRPFVPKKLRSLILVTLTWLCSSPILIDDLHIVEFVLYSRGWTAPITLQRPAQRDLGTLWIRGGGVSILAVVSSFCPGVPTQMQTSLSIPLLKGTPRMHP